jgi:Spy/CpxP family protein refolding chaperone
MKRLVLPTLLSALALSTACKPKPAPVVPTPAPEATATPTAQNSPSPGNPASGGDFQQRAEERMQRMKTDLGLTDEQAQKIRMIMDEQFGSLRQNMASMSREDRRAAFQKARDSANAQITQILTPEQQPKWTAWQQQMQQRRAQWSGGQGGGGNRGPQ